MNNNTKDTNNTNDTNDTFLPIFPWDNNEKPFWINPDNGYEWYVENSLTKYCNNKRLNNLKPINAICFFVVKVKNNQRIPMERVLIDKNTNEVIHTDTSLEGMACKIDWLRLNQSV